MDSAVFQKDHQRQRRLQAGRAAHVVDGGNRLVKGGERGAGHACLVARHVGNGVLADGEHVVGQIAQTLIDDEMAHAAFQAVQRVAP